MATPKQQREAAPRAKATQSLFRVIWRWHFYAGIIVSPVLIVMSITGGLYIFRAEIEEFARRDLVFVEPQRGRVDYQSQVDAAVEANPGLVPSQITAHNEIDRSTIVTLRPATQDGPPSRESFRRQVQVYVNPYDGKVLGQMSGESGIGTFFRTVLSIHRTLWAGTTGRVLTELTTSWSIVLVVTGVYLWWPKRKGKAAGVWTLRTKAKLYTLLRDMHAVVGVYLMPISGIILVTGMFYTLAVGTVINDAAHAWKGDVQEPRGGGDERAARKDVASKPRSGAETPPADQPPHAKSLPLDDLMGVMREKYPDRIVTATLGTGGRRGRDKATPPNSIGMFAGNDFNRTFGPMVNAELTLDKATGKVLAKKDSSETGFFWHAWTYPLHVGSFWGVATKIPWLIACVVLTALPITGLWMWWERRPRGRTGFPRRPDVRIPGWLIATIGGLCLLLPVMGASVVLILVGEGTLGLSRRIRRPAITPA